MRMNSYHNLNTDCFCITEIHSFLEWTKKTIQLSNHRNVLIQIQAKKEGTSIKFHVNFRRIEKVSQGKIMQQNNICFYN